ncbi:hypothetical protein [Aestuariivirga sp.]|uniref:hypothetical protein n=1 Tax=Aestuariivirga sp. TaxID=2650926 RepID=UPI003919677C
MRLIEIVILAGAQCMSPIESAEGLTQVSKVPCAVLVRQDPETSAVEIVPRSASTDPDVIAMLLQPRAPGTEVAAAPTIEPASIEEQSPGAEVPLPTPRDAAPARDKAEPHEEKAQAKPAKKKLQSRASSDAPAKKKKRVASKNPPDKCGSYKAVWYTNKEGRRKYRCVKV